jgi:hypothetical protein
VRARIRQLAGPSRARGAPLRADARVIRSEDGRLRLTLVVRSGDLVGTRRIEGTSCEDLAGAAAVALALLLRASGPLGEADLAGDGATEASPGRSSAGGAAPEGQAEAGGGAGGDPLRRPETAPPARQPEPSPAAREESPSRRRWRGVIEAPLGVVGLGPLPEPGLGVAAAAGVSLDRLRLLGEGRVFGAARMTARDEPGTGADVQLAAAGFRACWAALEGPIELSPCLAVTAQHLRARGHGDHIVPRTAESTWVAAGVGAELRWRLTSWFGLIAAGIGQVEASRPRIAIDGVGILGQIGWGSVLVMAGPEWIL